MFVKDKNKALIHGYFVFNIAHKTKYFWMGYPKKISKW